MAKTEESLPEKRKSPRLPVTMHLSISDLFQRNQPILGIHNLDAPIDIVEMSQCGIAFISECVLPINYYFNTNFDLRDETPAVFTVVRIVRSEAIDRSHYLYGCEFTNPPENLSDIILTHRRPKDGTGK